MFTIENNWETYKYIYNGEDITNKPCIMVVDGKEFTIQKKAKMKNIYNSGAGCTFSAAITAGLAKGLDIHQAFENAQNFIDKAVANSFKLNEFTGALAHWQTR